MPTTSLNPVRDLRLDLSNYRTVPQSDETQAVQAMISVSPDRFWALMDSLLEGGYLPTENILVLREETTPPTLIVKEGNRRIAAIKLILGYLSIDNIIIPDALRNKITLLSNDWELNNNSVPCTIYEKTEASIVDRIVTLAHGKGEKAGRDQWSAVARARHNRDINKSSEPALDLLEKYLRDGKNLTPQQAERWAGDYPITVLEEAIKRISTRFGVSNAPELAKQYPAIFYREALDNILLSIGDQVIRFDTIRQKTPDFATKYGVPLASTSASNSGNTTSSQAGAAAAGTSSSSGGASQASGSQGTAGSATGTSASSAETGQAPGSPGAQTSPTSAGSPTGVSGNKTAAVAIHDPRTVKRTLRAFKPVGNGRQKVVTLRNEALSLDLSKNPLAFCFVLRSMFEISAKAYCDDHKAYGGPSTTKPDGSDRRLVEVLKDIKDHLITLPNQKIDQATQKALHGAITELAKPEGILSVTSMNQLIHNPTFSVISGDICILFGNIYPLLAAMN